ncbi:UDP-N-acetylmuramoyl-L-alanine--D-glutamate ligase [Candidatus Kuenenbacteria bacterium]|nr:UDP-N-acetylmuramoyl-L-alanine--D-glutamate ligase [Candidatus Kuenenbacteria bacterium]
MQNLIRQLAEQNKKIAILGLGIENYALIKYLFQLEADHPLGEKHKVKYEITICDSRTKKELDERYNELNKKNILINWQLGNNFNKNLEKFDILFRSPGWPLSKIKNQKLVPSETEGSKIKNFSNPMQMFFELCPTKNIIGVTGTKGKGTTASLIYKILKTAGKKVWLGGNIGVAPFDFLDKIKTTDWVVLELSSFQLEDMTISPRISVITNFYPEHLAPADPNNPNFHKTLEEYWQAKSNIFKWQNKKDKTILNYKLKILNYKLNINTNTKIIYFKKSELPSRLIGEHNKENIAAAIEVAKIIKIKQNIIKKAVANFKGLEHRIELVRKYQGVKYYDDSFATTPEATIIALKSFIAPIVILLGGADKKANFQKLAKEIKNKVKFAVLLKGDATLKIKKKLLQAGFKLKNIKLTDNIKDAVKIAKENSVAGDIVLLSTACASFGMFKNYKERGKLFKNEVKKIGL